MILPSTLLTAPRKLAKTSGMPTRGPLANVPTVVRTPLMRGLQIDLLHEMLKHVVFGRLLQSTKKDDNTLSRGQELANKVKEQENGFKKTSCSSP